MNLALYMYCTLAKCSVHVLCVYLFITLENFAKYSSESLFSFSFLYVRKMGPNRLTYSLMFGESVSTRSLMKSTSSV